MLKRLHVFRSENKYSLSIENSIKLQKILDKVLERDSYAQENSYMVRSLYFDSIHNRDFQMKMAGTEIRKKIRIRTYNVDDKKCKLEMKKKNGDLQSKISLWITKEEAKELIKCNFAILNKYFDTIPESIEIYTTLVLGSYRPVVLIEYERVAYTYRLYNTRITFDSNIRSSESNFSLFEKNPIYNSIENNQVVLEVKYNEKLMDFISDILKPFHLTKVAVSKYCLGRRVYQDFDY